MNPVTMLNRIMRYDTKRLLEIFNEACEKAGMPDSERKVVFDSQAEVIAHVTQHKAGTGLNPKKLVEVMQAPMNKRDLPQDMHERLSASQKILAKYPKGDDISQTALCAIIREYFVGGVFTPKQVE